MKKFPNQKKFTDAIANKPKIVIAKEVIENIIEAAFHETALCFFTTTISIMQHPKAMSTSKKYTTWNSPGFLYVW